jgi:hypothetical protein
LAVLREAWSRTINDSVMLAEASKAGLPIKTQEAAEIAANVARAGALPTTVLDRTAALLEWKR